MVTFIVAIIVGVFVGLLSGLLGVGGGTVMVPVFRLGFGLSAIGATATSLFAIVPTSLGGCITHIRNRTCVVPIGVAAGLGGACTSVFGVWLASMSPSWAIMLAAGCVIGYSAITMFKKARALRPVEPIIVEQASAFEADMGVLDEAAAEEVAEERDEATFDTAPRTIGIAAAIGLAAGVASGYVGVGGGFIMVPMFIALLGLPMKKASGTSLIAIIILAIPGVISQAFLGNVDYLAGIALAIGSIPGAVAGANLVAKIKERTLRYAFSVVLLAAAAVLVVNEIAPML